jgi:predicted MFS family arabinose efflux permease
MVWLLFLLFFDVSVGQVALVPLLPHFVHAFSLSPVQAGALISSISFAMVAVALPVGFLADRFGARRLALGAAALVVLASLGQGFASEFWMLLVSRAVFGLGHATMWTGALAWLADLAPPERRTQYVGAATPVSGIGFAVGPAFAGLTAQHFGTFVPFAVVAGVAALALPALARGRPHVRPDVAPADLRRSLQGALRQPLARAGLLINVLTALTFGTGVVLLVPLELGRHGFSASRIGVIFSAVGIIGVLVGFAVARLGDRAATIRVATVGTAAAGVGLIVPTLSGANWALIGYVLLAGLASSVLATICFPLAVRGAHAAGIGRGSVVGVSNVCFGTAAVLGPIVCGALVGAVGARAGFAVLLAWAVVTLTILLAKRR